MAGRTKSINISRKKNGEYTLKFKEQCIIDHIYGINERINVIFDDAKSIHLDLSDIAFIELSGIQLIDHINKRCKEANILLKVKNPFTSKIEQILQKTGFEELTSTV